MALSAMVSLLQFPLFILIKGPLQNNRFYVSTVRRGVALALDLQGRPRQGHTAGPQQGASQIQLRWCLQEHFWTWVHPWSGFQTGVNGIPCLAVGYLKPPG